MTGTEIPPRPGTPAERNELSALINGALADTRQGRLYWSARNTLIDAILTSTWLEKREALAAAKCLRQMVGGLEMTRAELGDITLDAHTEAILAVLVRELLKGAEKIEQVVDHDVG